MKKLTLNQILVSVALGIFLGITAFSAIALCNKGAVPGTGLRKIEKVSPSKNDAAFDLIGLLRITVRTGSDQTRHVMVLSPWLEYDKNDVPLYEELDRKLVSIKSVFTNYFSSKTKEELLSMSEAQIKEELLQKINDMLILGKVQKLYFKDYIFLS